MSGSAKNGEIVVVEITRWPANHQPPSGKVTEVLGSPDDPDVEVEILVKKYGLSTSFPAGVLAAAEAVPSEVSSKEASGRVDLRKKTLVTIDGETAKDFDDAVCVEKHQGGYRLYISIADVSHYVTVGSPLDVEARERGTSVYFPDRCVPMLPERLSNGICSLNPDVDRLAFTAELTFDKDGAMKARKFYKSVIKSRERLTYTTVKGLLEGDITEGYDHVAGDLRLMEELASLLSKRRTCEGSIDFDLPEPQIIIDIEGRIEDIVRSERNVAHRLIEEFMLAANMAVAGEFSRKALPFLYRIHGEPDPDSIADFRDFIAGFGYALKKTKKGSYLPKHFQKVLADCAGRPEEKLINHVLLRAMQRAVYSTENSGHFGLAFTDYTHFTSPIRRYPDLVVHRLLNKLLTKRYGPEEERREAASLPSVAAHASAMERKATEAEREIVDLKKAQFMKDKVGESFSGFISGVTSFGFFVELNEFFIEGLVHISSLAGDYYSLVDKEHYLIGEHTKKVFRVGDAVEVKIEAVNIPMRKIDMLLDVKSAPPKMRGKKRAPAPASRKGRKGGKRPTSGKKG